MAYQKPELTVLGKATEVVLGVKHRFLESYDPESFQNQVDCELDD